MKLKHSVLMCFVLALTFALPFALAETGGIPAADMPAAYVQIAPGETGDAVTTLQMKLIDLGYLTGEASGTLDEATEAALTAFQSDNGLDPDGIATPELQEAIFAATAPESIDAADKGDTVKQSTGSTTYIGNKKTKKFHDPDCASVKDMKDSNKVELSTRDEAIDLGYQPCKRCNP